MNTNLSMGNFQDLATTFRELLRMTPDQMTKTSAPDFLKTAAVNAQNDIRFGGERGAPPNSTVAENVLRTAMGNNQPPPQMPPQGVPGMDAAPQMPPQGAQAGGYIHDFGVASLPYTPNYEHGGIVSFGGTTDGSYVDPYAAAQAESSFDSRGIGTTYTATGFIHTYLHRGRRYV